MPAGNETQTNSDYRVGTPPPEAEEQQLLFNIKGGIATSALGSVVMLVAALTFESRGLLWAGFALSMVGAAIAWLNVSRLSRLLASDGAGRAPVAKRSLSGGPLGVSRAAAEACPAPAVDSRYRLDAQESSDCPPSWSMGQIVTFYERDTTNVLKSVTLGKDATTVTLREIPALGVGVPPDYEIDVT